MKPARGGENNTSRISKILNEKNEVQRFSGMGMPSNLKIDDDDGTMRSKILFWLPNLVIFEVFGVKFSAQRAEKAFLKDRFLVEIFTPKTSKITKLRELDHNV